LRHLTARLDRIFNVANSMLAFVTRHPRQKLEATPESTITGNLSAARRRIPSPRIRRSFWVLETNASRVRQGDRNSSTILPITAMNYSRKAMTAT
jgi:hypothetical protein